MTEDRKISRRDLLIKGSAVLGTGIAGYISYKLGQASANVEASYAMKVRKQNLNATVEVVKRKDESTSFVPEGKFTNEFFNTVRNSTYFVNFMTKNGLYGATCWCAHKEGNYVYLVTNKHVIDEPKKVGIQSINIWRPNLDTQKYTLLNVTTAVSNNSDVGLLKCELDPEQSKNMKPLSFQDNFSVKSGDKLLIVGFPMEFISAATNDLDYLTSALITTAFQGNSERGTWLASGLVDLGNSGSPAVLPDEQGNPLVVGVVSALSDTISTEKSTQQVQPIVVGSPLGIGVLMAYANKS